MNKILSVNNLEFSFNKDMKVIKGISFDINEGEIVSIVGPNGSGKSTLAKLLIGLLSPEAGSINIFGKELNDKNVKEIRKDMGIVFQNPDNQFIGATVQDDIAFGLENRCIKRDEIERRIEFFSKQVGMEKFLTKEPVNLSGGQKQRVAIAGVLALYPKILILDEATAMLDPEGKREIMTLLSKLKNENPSLTIITITHDVEEAFLADRVVVVKKGNLIATGSPIDVFSNKEKLEESGLKLPFVLQVCEALGKEGINVGKCKNMEDIVAKLCR